LSEGLARSCIGRSYLAEDVLAEAETMRAFARAACDPNPRYLAGDIVAHPLFAVRLIRGLMPQVFGDPELRCDTASLVHGEQRYEYHRPIRAGAQVQPRGEIVAIDDKSSGQILHLRQQLIVDGEIAVEGRAAAFIRGSGPMPAKDLPSGSKSPTKGAPLPLLASSSVQVTPQHPLDYAQASGDHNPIHTDREVARAAGFKDVILHGTCALAFALRTVVDEVLDGEIQRVRETSVRFSSPVSVGDTVCTQVRGSGDGTLHFEARNGEGRVLLSRGLVQCHS